MKKYLKPTTSTNSTCLRTTLLAGSSTSFGNPCTNCALKGVYCSICGNNGRYPK